MPKTTACGGQSRSGWWEWRRTLCFNVGGGGAAIEAGRVVVKVDVLGWAAIDMVTSIEGGEWWHGLTCGGSCLR